MADVRVQSIAFPGATTSSAPVPVEVAVNNLETVGPYGFADDELGGLIGENPAVCGGELANSGHLTDVTLTIRNQSGDVVFEKTKSVCAIVQRPSDTISPPDKVTFSPQLDAGTYTVMATSQVRGDSMSDTSQQYRLEVASDTSDLPSGDEPGDTIWDIGTGGSGDGDGPLAGIGAGSGSIDKILVVLAILAIAWIADSGSDILSG